MEKCPLIKLYLRSNLVYAEITDFYPDTMISPPAEKTAGKQVREELLFCYELDPKQGRSIEPERDKLLGALVFAGEKAETMVESAQTVTLPAGKYLFVQRREALNREEWLDMAVEQQKDGLWERQKPENRLYVRYLYEEGKPVTQLFRPCGEP